MKDKYKIYKKFVVIISVITCIISIISYKTEGYKYIFFIPIVYLIMFLLCKRLHEYSRHNKGMLILNGFMFIKYVISILLICIYQDYKLPRYYAINVSDYSYQLATLYIIIEMISIFFIIIFFADFFYKKKNDDKDRINEPKNTLQIGPILILFIIIAIVFLVVYRDEFISKALIIFSSGNSLTENIETNNFLYLVFNAFKIIVMGLLVNKFIFLYRTNKKRRYILYSYITICIYSFLQISTSRMNIILPFIFFLLLTEDIFDNKTRTYNIILILFLGLTFSIVSSYKNPWLYSNEKGVLTNIKSFSNGIQEYTSNIRPMACGVQFIENYKEKIDLVTLFNDFFGSIPKISHLIDGNNRIYRYYNLYVLNGSSMSQVVPMTIASAAYFTPLFCFLMVDFNILLLMFFETKVNYGSDNFLHNYLCLYLLFIFASCLNSNVQMLTGRIFSNFLPSMLILLLNNKIKYRSRRNIV